ncbi:hypothetical protein SAMN06309944_1322 [Micrococcales bacterium KH10]|nr:hypothetical protein SAMN06309944_1322 [Micrococcales bacterium KH10]
MNPEEAREIVGSGASTPEQLLAALEYSSALAPQIAGHPRADVRVLDALLALQDPQVDAVLAWRQPPPGGWDRPLILVRLSPDAVIPQSSAQTSQNDSHYLIEGSRVARTFGTPNEDASLPGGFVGAGSTNNERKNPRRKRWLVAAAVVALIAVLGTAAVWKWSPSKPAPGQDVTMRSYLTIPEKAWTLTPNDFARAASRAGLAFGSEPIFVWQGHGDRGLVTVTAESSRLIGTEGLIAGRHEVNVHFGVDLTKGVINWVIDSQNFEDGDEYDSCRLSGQDLVICTYFNQEGEAREIAFDGRTGQRLVTPNGSWVGAHGLIITATPNQQEGFVRFAAVRNDERLWHSDVSLAADYLETLVAHADDDWAFTSFENAAIEDAVVLQVSRPVTCDFDESAYEDDEVVVCTEYNSGSTYIALDSANGEELLVSEEPLHWRQGSRWITDTPPQPVSEEDHDWQPYQVIDTTTGATTPLPVTVPSDIGLTTSVQSDGDVVLVQAAGEITAFHIGNWDVPLWEAKVSEPEDYGVSVHLGGGIVVVDVPPSADSALPNEVSGRDLGTGQQLWVRNAHIIAVDKQVAIVTPGFTQAVAAFSIVDNKDYWNHQPAGWVESVGSWLVDCDVNQNCGGLTAAE